MWTTGECWGGGATCTNLKCSEYDYFYNNVVNGKPCSPNGTVFGNVGHFTQVMWANTGWVGCAWTAGCGTICDYVVAGNMNLPSGTLQASNIWGVGGAVASKCPTGTTSANGLCRSTSPLELGNPNTGWKFWTYIAAGIVAFIILLIIAAILYSGVKRRRAATQAGLAPENAQLQEKFDGFENLQLPSASGLQAEVNMPMTELGGYAPISPSSPSSPPSTHDSPISSPHGSPLTTSPIEPVALALKQSWERYFDAERGAFYYFNHETGESQWVAPEGFTAS